ncbi:MAG: DUF1707 domain-containing protein [Spirochaetales bacterium]
MLRGMVIDSGWGERFANACLVEYFDPMDKTPGSAGTRYGVPAYREQITTRLSEAYGQNMLDQRELERRLDLAQKAETIEELKAVVADFGPEKATRPRQTRGGESQLAATGQRHTQVMSSHNHVLDPELEDGYRGLNIMGGTVLDLRAFRGSGVTLVVTLSGCMAEYRVKVPRGTRVVRESRLVMGELHIRSAGQPGVLTSLWKKLVGNSDPPPASPYPADGPPPTVILRGTMVMGSITVKEES